MGKATELDKSGAGLQRGVDGEKLDTMMVVGEPPWHYSYNEDLVNLLAKGTRVTSADVNKAAGLDWDVYQDPMPMRMPDGTYEIAGYRHKKDGAVIPFAMQNRRSDNHQVVGVVKEGYVLFPNQEAPLFLDTLVDDGEAVYETAGSLHGGSQVWWLMKIPEGVTIGGVKGEDLNTYILFSNSHDGSLSLTVSIVSVRVVCQNTLSWALRGAQRTLKIRHTKNASQRITEARKTLEVGFAYQAELAEIGGRMIEQKFSEADFKRFLDEIVPLPEPKHKITDAGAKVTNQFAITVKQQIRDKIVDIYDQHPTQKQIRGTMWGAVQAVEFYSDHLAFTKGVESRFKALTKGQTLGKQAFDHAYALLDK